jgi:5'-nucleotidase
VVANIPIVQSGSKLQSFSTIELTLDARNRVRGYSVNADSVPRAGGPHAIVQTWNGAAAQWRGREVRPDAKVAAVIAGYDAQVKKLRESVVGETRIELRKGGKDDLLGSLAADALRSGAGGGLIAQFAFQNAGGLRITEIPEGPITFGQVFDLIPFDNQQVVVKLGADQIRGALEAVLRHGKNPMRVSGLRYVIDWERFGARESREVPAGAIVTRIVDDATGAVLCETKSCSSGRCEPACAEGTYSVATSDFLANGGDGLSMLVAAPRQLGNVLARDLLVAYLKAHRPLTADVLGAGRARWKQIGTGRRALE